MIRALRTGAATVLTPDDGDRLAFIDGDWIGGGEQVPALLVDAQGVLWWDGECLATGEDDPRRFAEALLGAQAEAIAAAVHDLEPQRVWVLGGGLVASQVRRLLGQTTAATAGERPLAAIDLTGVALEHACEAVLDGGTVVLAGERRERCDIDLYRHVHRRGLTVVGIPDVRTRVPSISANGSRPESKTTLPEPATVTAGEPLPAALWYRLVRR